VCEAAFTHNYGTCTVYSSIFVRLSPQVAESKKNIPAVVGKHDYDKVIFK
jgi:hypothetical protein